MKKKQHNFLVLLLALCVLLNACASPDVFTRKERKSLHTQIAKSPIFSKSFTGFALYDPQRKTMLYEQYADKYFTPASNTKIFTFYTTLKVLGDSIPALKYYLKEDSLIFWGTGDPSLFHPHLTPSSAVINFLKSRPEQLFFCPDNFMDERYGAGWMWDDYPYSYQVDKAAMPIYGNVIAINGEKESTNFNISPSYFSQKIEGKPELNGTTARFYREKNSNVIGYNQKAVGKLDITREVPFIYSDTLLLQLLEDSLSRKVQLMAGIGTPPQESQSIYSIPTDSVLQRMMQVSDNFLAEQLLLLCANELFDTLNTAKIIAFAKDSLLRDMPDTLLWYDGSGLSRYNRFTPRSIVHLLERIYTEIPREKWQSLFPAGGQSGTIQNFYGNGNRPYIFAKTGSMRYVHCLSGFLQTKSGNTLIFSFMHNGFKGSSLPLKKEMERILKWLYEVN